MSSIGPVTPNAAQLIGITASNLVEKARIDAQAKLAKAELDSRERIAKMTDATTRASMDEQAKQAEADRAQQEELQVMEQEFWNEENGARRVHDEKLAGLAHENSMKAVEYEQSIEEARANKQWDRLMELKKERAGGMRNVLDAQAKLRAADMAIRQREGELEVDMGKLAETGEKFAMAIQTSREQLSSAVSNGVRAAFGNLLTNDQFKQAMRASGGSGVGVNRGDASLTGKFKEVAPGPLWAGWWLVGPVRDTVAGVKEWLRPEGEKKWQPHNAAAVVAGEIATAVVQDSGLEAYAEKAPGIRDKLAALIWMSSARQAGRMEGKSTDGIDQSIREAHGELLEMVGGDPIVLSKIMKEVGEKFQASLGADRMMSELVGDRGKSYDKDEKMRQVFEFLSGADDGFFTLKGEKGEELGVDVSDEGLDRMVGAVKDSTGYFLIAMKNADPELFAKKLAELKAAMPKDKFDKLLGWVSEKEVTIKEDLNRLKERQGLAEGLTDAQLQAELLQMDAGAEFDILGRGATP